MIINAISQLRISPNDSSFLWKMVGIDPGFSLHPCRSLNRLESAGLESKPSVKWLLHNTEDGIGVSVCPCPTHLFGPLFVKFRILWELEESHSITRILWTSSGSTSRMHIVREMILFYKLLFLLPIALFTHGYRTRLTAMSSHCDSWVAGYNYITSWVRFKQTWNFVQTLFSSQRLHRIPHCNV